MIIGEHCEKNPNDRLFEVVQKMVITLTNDRLKQPSDMVTLKLKDNKGDNRAHLRFTRKSFATPRTS